MYNMAHNNMGDILKHSYMKKKDQFEDAILFIQL